MSFLDDQRLVLETHDVYQNELVQCAITQEVMRPSKQWVANVIHGVQESEAVKIRHADFVLLPDTERVNRYWSVRQIINKRYFSMHATRLNLLAILTEPKLRSLRDLRGKHVPVLENMYAMCLAKIEEETGISPDQVMAYVHYPPSVYQLHVHFVHQPYPRNARDCYRVHSLHSVISNLKVDPEYYAKVSMHFQLSTNSPLYSAITQAYLNMNNSKSSEQTHNACTPYPIEEPRGDEEPEPRNEPVSHEGIHKA